MEHFLELIAIAMLGALVGALGWFIQGKLKGYDAHHKVHYRHSADTNAHWTERERDELSSTMREIRVALRRQNGHHEDP